MKKKNLILEVIPEDHAEIKSWAAKQGMTIREWVLKAIARQMRIEHARKDNDTSNQK